MKKILVINVNWLGDVVFSTPFLKALKKAYPDSFISCLVVSRCQEVLKKNSRINEIIIYDEYGKHRNLINKIKFLRYLRNKNFDEVYVLHPSLKRAMIGFLAGIPKRVGYNTKNRSFLLTDVVPAPDKLMHKIDYFLNIIGYFGIDISDRKCEFFIDDNDIDDGRDILRTQGLNNDDRYVLLNPGGNWNKKRWDVKHFAKLADKIIENNVKVVIAGAKRDKELALNIKEKMQKEPIIISGLTTLHQLASIMRCAVCVVTADSGPMHIAVATGAKVVAIFGPTSPDLTGPIGSGNKIILQKNIGCEIPCYDTNCKDNRCMDVIMPEDVYREVLKYLQKGEAC